MHIQRLTINEVPWTLTVVEFKPRTRVAKKYSDEDLKDAFNRVCNKKNWKLSVNSTIDFKDLDELDLIREAVIHYTGSVPRFNVYELKNGKKRVRVNAVGYYNAIGA